MALQNRVDPYGRIVADPARGTLTGNRGVLHDGCRNLVRNHATRRWIICTLEDGGSPRRVMTPSRWTELFFLDEATAMSAGHRPCFACRRREAVEFAELWNAVRGRAGRALVDEVDWELHAWRRHRWARAVRVDDLPRGAMIEVDERPAVVVGAGVRMWSFAGYGPERVAPAEARLLTPPPTVAVLVAGYQPSIAL